MTGQEFIDGLQRVIMDNGKLNKEYSLTNLVEDAGAVGLFGGLMSPESQEKDLAAAREEAKKLDKPGGPHESHR